MAEFIAPFEFATATRIIFGRGTLSQIGPIAKSFGKKVFIVTGKNVERAKPLIIQLEKAGLEHATFGVGEEPTTEIATAGLELARKEKCDVVISFGGGSAIDAGKAIAAILSNGGEFLDYMEVVGRGKSLNKPSTPFIAIPTTAGTGAEVTRNSVLCSTQHKQKVSVRSPHMLPAVALVDPELTISMPKSVTASTGLDAFTQVLEVFVSNKANPITDALCREALKRASQSLKRAFDDGNDIKAREDMCIVSLFGGLALANAKLGAVHGFAGSFGGMFDSPHGAVCAALLPHVIDVNVSALKQRDPNSQYLKRFDEVAQLITGNQNATSADAVKWIQDLCNHLQVPGLKTYGLTKEGFAVVVEKSSTSSSMLGNPIKLTTEELTTILERSY